MPGDSGLNLARGRLLLRHLELLSGWNRNGGTPESLGVDLQGGAYGDPRAIPFLRQVLDEADDAGEDAWVVVEVAAALEKLGASLSDEQRAKRGRAIAARRAS